MIAVSWRVTTLAPVVCSMSTLSPRPGRGVAGRAGSLFPSPDSHPYRVRSDSMSQRVTIVVLEGDQTGQELLDQAVRLLDSELLELDLELRRFDLSLDSRRATSNGVVSEAAAAMRDAGLGLKAATIT